MHVTVKLHLQLAQDILIFNLKFTPTLPHVWSNNAPYNGNGLRWLFMEIFCKKLMLSGRLGCCR